MIRSRLAAFVLAFIVVVNADFAVQVGMANGLHAVEAVDWRTRETFVVRSDDLYRTVVELAQHVGIKLEDG